MSHRHGGRTPRRRHGSLRVAHCRSRHPSREAGARRAGPRRHRRDDSRDAGDWTEPVALQATDPRDLRPADEGRRAESRGRVRAGGVGRRPQSLDRLRGRLVAPFRRSKRGRWPDLVRRPRRRQYSGHDAVGEHPRHVARGEPRARRSRPGEARRPCAQGRTAQRCADRRARSRPGRTGSPQARRLHGVHDARDRRARHAERRGGGGSYRLGRDRRRCTCRSTST